MTVKSGVIYFATPKDIRLVVYYESIKRELKIRPIYQCRYDERLKNKAEESTRHGDI